MSLTLTNPIGRALKQIIAETYEEIDGELNIQLGNVEPPKVKDLVKVTLGSKNCEINKEKDEVLCRKVTVSDVVSVTASIRLDPQVCRVLRDSDISARKITVDFRVFGQKSEKLSIEIGRTGVSAVNMTVLMLISQSQCVSVTARGAEVRTRTPSVAPRTRGLGMTAGPACVTR